MRSQGAAPGPAAPLCGALSLVLGALLGKVIEARGVPDGPQRLSSLPPYLPVNFQVRGAESFFLKETHPNPLLNASLRSRVEPLFTYKAKQPPVLNASCGPYSVEKVVPLDLMLDPNFLGPSNKFPFDWRLRASILQDKVYPSRPKVQVFFHVVGRDWGDPQRAAEKLPCLRVFAFRETREVRGSCRLAGALGLCVAELQLLPGWFSSPSVVAGRRRPAEQPQGSPVELYYTVQPGDDGEECVRGDVRKDNAIRPGKDGQDDRTSQLRRIGVVSLYRTQDSAQLSELRLDSNVVIWLPSRPVKQGDVVTAYVTVSSNSTVDLFILRAKVKKGVTILSAQASESRLWGVRQEVGNGGKHTSTSVVCQRLGPVARNRSSSLVNEVAQMSFEVSSLSGTQPITWQVEYPQKGTTDVAVSEIFVSQRDLVAIVPLAMDTELLNTAVLTGKPVALPVRVVSVEENGTVRDISEQVECKAADEDVLKVSDHCDYVFVNGKEMKSQTDAVVHFTFQHLSAPLHITVWAPRLPLHIEVSDTELSQIKGWRVPIVASKRPTRESEEEEEEEQRGGRGCALQFQHATVRVLTQFVSEGAGPWGQLSHLLSPDWQFDITHLVADFMKLEAPHVATLQGGSRVLVGREVGMTTIQVLSPLSDSILAEKTVTVLEDKVSVTDLAVQLLAGLTVTLHPVSEHRKATTVMAVAEELLRSPKQEAMVSTWLQFSDGAVTPLDIYDPKDFSLTAASLDEAVMSVPRAASPGWPTVVAEGEGQGPLLRVDLSIAEACQKSKRKSVLAAGIGHVTIKFGQDEAASGPPGDPDEEEIKNRASERRHKGQDPERAADGRLLGGAPGDREEGALRRATTTSKALLDNKVGKGGRLDGARLSRENQMHNIPMDFTNFPAHVDVPRVGSELQETGLVQAARGLSDLEIGMYALLGVFCLAILVFLVNCATFAFKYRHKQMPLEGQASATHSHDWVWLGNEAEPLEHIGDTSPGQGEHTTVLDCGLGGCEESNHLLLNGGSQKHLQSQAHRPVGSGAQLGKEPKPEPTHSPTSKRKKVQFATFTSIQPEDGGSPCPTMNSGVEDVTWVCRDLDTATPQELRTYLEKFRENV